MNNVDGCTCQCHEPSSLEAKILKFMEERSLNRPFVKQPRELANLAEQHYFDGKVEVLAKAMADHAFYSWNDKARLVIKFLRGY